MNLHAHLRGSAWRFTPFTRLAMAAAWAAALAACNGGGGGSEGEGTAGVNSAADTAQVSSSTAGGIKRALAVVNPTNWVTVPTRPDALLQNLNIPADAPTRGMWSGSGGWPFVGVHATLLPNGRVLTWGTNPDGSQQNGRYFDVWDSSLGLGANSHQTSFDAARQDSFCSTATYLTDGRLLITGGNANGGVGSSLYTTSNNSLVSGNSNVADQRWYATMMTLPDGRPVIVGGMQPYTEGMYNNPDQSVTQGLASMTPEVFENGAWRTLFGGFSRDAFGPDFLRASYPRAWVAPDGRVFGVSTEKMWWLNPAGNGGIVTAGNFKTAPNEGTRPNVGATNSAVMYAPGKVLVLGGNAYHNGFGTSGSSQVTSIDINGANPVLSEQRAMNFGRHFPNTIVLPDGKVLVTGGESAARNDPAFSVPAVEIWNPATGLWQVGASAGVFRGYHSITTLLPNGTVLSVGGGTPGPAQLRGEVYYPPYLFRSVNGAAQLAPRPVMVAISGLSYANGAQVQVDMATNEPIAQVALVGLSSGTHSFNGGQRRIPLTGLQQEGIRLTVALPSNTLAPPGYYQLVALNAAGVPSLGTIIAVGQGVSAPAVPTTPYTPPNLGAAPIAAPVISAGNTATFTVPAQAGVTYSWDFGDGSPATAASAIPTVTRVYAQPGVYGVTLTARAADGALSRRSFVQGVGSPPTARQPNASGPMAMEIRANGASARVWVVNPDNNSVSVIDTGTNAMTEIAVGQLPRSVAVAGDGRIWVSNRGASTLSIINPATLAVVQTVALPRASQPYGLAFAPGGGPAFVVLEATGQLLRLDPASGAQQAALALGDNVRHVSVAADGATALVSRFITPPLPGEATAVVNTTNAGGEVLAVNTATMALQRVVTLRHSDKPDNEVQGSGVPNYLAAAVISPDGKSAWVPSKQDNIKRGSLRNQQGLNFQNSVRAISSRIDMATLAEDFARRVDHDNASLGSAAAYHPNGVYLFVALETSRQVAVLDAAGGRELFRLEVGRAPQGVQVSADGRRLAVQNFMDRSVSFFDLTPLVTAGELRASLTATVRTVGGDRLPPQVLLGKQLFYDARDPRLARDSYMSCASCHNDAGHDGRTWDFTGFGEGLRNTPTLRGRAGMGHGFVHWSGNFDEIQDFEGQIRAFAGGTGLMTDAQFNTGTRSQPLGERKAGVSADLDALTAYLSSLTTVDPSPQRNADSSTTAAANAGKLVFDAQNCASCHTAPTYTASNGALRNVGTQKPSSGNRLSAALTGIDVPTLLGVGATAPYLHDGSAPTLAAAVQAHSGVAVPPADMPNLVAYLQQLEATVPIAPVNPLPAGALGAWDFDTATASLAPDTSGQNNPLTLGAGTQLVNTGLAGNAFRMLGAASATAAVSARPVLNTAGSFTVSGWVKLDQLPDCWNQVLASQDGATVSGFYLGIAPPCNGQPAQWLFSMLGADADAGAQYRVTGGAPTVGQWAHLAGVRDAASNTMMLYVNGVRIGSINNPTKWNAGGSFVVGRARFSASLRDTVYGSIDAVRAYGSALPASDVTALFNARGLSTVTPPPPPAPPAANLAPTVSLAAPAAGAAATVGTPLTVAANAADGDGTVVRVEFFEGALSLGVGTTAPFSINWTPTTAGTRTLTARATDNAGATTTSAAVAVNVTAAAVPPQPPSGTGTGLLARYFSNTTLTGAPVLTRTEVPFFDWGVGAPGPGVPADNFSVRWTGQVQAVEAGNYQFRTNSDDGVRVWVDGNLVINNWTVHVPTVDTSPAVALTAGQRVAVVVEFQEFAGGAVLQLSWLRPGGAWVPVPAAQLYPAAATTPPAGNVPPTVGLTAPATDIGVVQGTAVALAATAADSDGTVARVEFYSDATLLGTDTTAPYTFNWTAPAVGSYSVTARAFDNLGVSTSSAARAVTVTAAPVAGALANGVYRLVAVHSGKVLDVSGVSTANSAAVVQWPWTGSNNQRWQVTALGDGIYTLSAVHSGKLLDMRNCSVVDGGVAQQFAANATPNCQRWRITAEPSGGYRLTNINSGKVLDVAGVSAADGAAVHQWTWLNGANQRWRIERL